MIKKFKEWFWKQNYLFGHIKEEIRFFQKIKREGYIFSPFWKNKK